jgi:hypothetical protein
VKLWKDLGIASDGSLIEKTRLLEICGVEGKSNAFLVWQDPVNPGEFHPNFLPSCLIDQITENNTTKGSFRGVEVCKVIKEALVELLHACSSNSRPSTPPSSVNSGRIDKTTVDGLLGCILTIPPEVNSHLLHFY